MNPTLFLARHVGLARKEMIVHDMGCFDLLEMLAYTPYNNSCLYIVLRKGERRGAYAAVDFISTLRDLIFIVVYGLCDGSEEYMYDSRNY